MPGPIDLSDTPIHIPDDGAASTVPLTGFGFDGPSFEAYIGEHCNEAGAGRLMMIETTASDWQTWERHTAGEEIVFIIEGAGEFIQDIDGKEIRIDIQPGVTIINPKSVWHTANVTTPVKAIYLTPCPGTEHKPR